MQTCTNKVDHATLEDSPSFPDYCPGLGSTTTGRGPHGAGAPGEAGLGREMTPIRRILP